MEELENKKNILLKNKERILKMRNTKEKAEIVDAYIRLLRYYSEVLDENDYDLLEELSIDDEFVGKYDNLVLTDTQKDIDEMYSCVDSLYEKYCKIIETFKENDYCTHAYFINAKVNPQKMKNLVYYFFESLGEDVLNLYLKMADGKNILANNMKMGYMGYTLDTLPIDNPCIVVQNAQKNFAFYLTLVHEVGHAYQFYIQRNQKNYSSLMPYAEITSHLFERLFLDYLKNVHEDKYCFVFEEEDYNYFLNDVSASKIFCDLMINKNITCIDPYCLACLVPEDKMKDELINDCGYVLNYENDINLTILRYSIGKVIAMYFHEKLKNDFNHEWKKYKDFLCTVNYLPMNEVMEKYFDVDLVTENIKKFTKSYHGR